MTSIEAAIPRPPQPLVDEGTAEPEVLASSQEIQLGQALAQMELEEIISKTRRWAEVGRLNRGLRLSIPFFDDHFSEMRWLDIDVIPNGRILFVPAFVVLAVHRTAQRARKDRRLTASSKAHVLNLLRILQQAFGPVPEEYNV